MTPERKESYKRLFAKMYKEKKPAMEDEDIQALEKEILDMWGDKVINILEWGSGYSTKYFSKIGCLTKTCLWESIEYDVMWYAECIKWNLPNVRFHLFDEPILRTDDRRALRNRPMTEYIKFLAKLGKKYDIIIIDGAKRNECLKEATKLLKPNGFVILHDARRPEYKEGMSLYKGEFLTNSKLGLWKGKLSQ